MKLHVVLRQSPGNSLLVLVATVCLAFTTFAQGKLLVGGMCVSDQKLTTTDPLGPFYIENSPMISTIAPAEFLVNNADVLSITGKVMGNDCVPLANARVEAWYAGEKDAFGEFYSASKYRGQQITDSCGNFKFIQTFPALYPGRPIPHIHYRVSSEDGTLLLVTQLYFEGAIPVFFNPDDTKISQIVNEADGSRSADFPIYVSIPGNVKNAENCILTMAVESTTILPSGTMNPTDTMDLSTDSTMVPSDEAASTVGDVPLDESESIITSADGVQCLEVFCVAPKVCCKSSCRGECIDPGTPCRARACVGLVDESNAANMGDLATTITTTGTGDLFG